MADSERHQLGLAMADQDERFKRLTESMERLQDDNESWRLRCATLEQEAIALQERSLTMHPAADLERASQETIELRAQLNQSQDEVKALRAWKDGKLKTDTNRRADADRARRERDAIRNDLNEEREQHARTVRAIREELKHALADLDRVRQREAALATREQQLERSTQVMLRKRAQDAVAKKEDLRTIVITTRAVHDTLIKQGQDPVQALPGPNFGALLLELSDLGIKCGPKAALSTLLLRFLPGSDSQEPALTLQRALVDARVWLHQIGMHIEVMTGQLGIFQGKYTQASAQLKACEETLRLAWQLVLETELQVQKLVGRVDNAARTFPSRHEREAGH
jgi:flagellar biosynthesis GTPase FlhF